MPDKNDRDFFNSLLPPPDLDDDQAGFEKSVIDKHAAKKQSDALQPPPPLTDDEDVTTVPRGEATTSAPSVIVSETNPLKCESTIQRFPVQIESSSSERLESKLELEGYDIQCKVGQGGMGVVYLANDKSLGREVAIKVLNATASSKLRDRFLIEAQTVARLRHPNIAALYTTDEYRGQPCLVMEYVNSGSLQERINYSPQSPIAAAQTVKILAEAMHYCHEQGVLHRDLKPSNILLDKRDTLKIADFGLAKSLLTDSSATRTGEILGTPGYMAPEQASGVVKTMGPACDIYGLGGILYTMLTGRMPFDSPDPMRTVMMVLSDSPVSPRKLQSDIPKDMETVCLKCLEKSPRNRYSSAAELAEDLDRFINHRPIKARPVSRVEKVSKWARRHPASAALILIVVAAIPAIFAAQWYHSRQLAKELDRSRRLANQGSDFSEWVIRNHIGQLRGFNGTTTIQHDVAVRSQEYLDTTTPDAPQTSKFLLRHADAYRRLAQILGSSANQNLGRSEQAMKNYQMSIKLFEKAMRLAPDDAKTHRMMAVCYVNMSELASHINSGDSRKEFLQKAIDTLEASNQKRGPQFRLAQVMVHDALANQHIEDHLFNQALDELLVTESLIPELTGDVADSIPELRMTIARKRAQAYGALGQYEQAVAKAQKSVDLINQSINGKQSSLILNQQLSSNLILLADNQCHLGKFDEAVENYEKSQEIREKRHAEDTGNVSATIDLGVALSRLATAWLYLEKPVRALPLAERAVELNRELVANDANNLDHRKALLIDIGTVASIYTQLGKAEKALTSHLERRDLLLKLTASKSPQRGDVILLGEVYFYMALHQLTQLMNEVTEVGPAGIRERSDYVEMSKNFSASLATFERAEKMAPLSQSEQTFLESVRQTMELAESSVDQMKGTQHDEVF